MLTSDLRYEISRTHFESGARTSADKIRGLFAELEREAIGRLRAWFDGPIAIQRAAEMRYGEQIFEIDVPLDDVDRNAPSLVRDIEDRFHRRHEELYTYASRDQDVVFVNARVAAVGAVPRVTQPERPAAASACTPRARRQAYFGGGWREVAVFALDDLKPGHTIEGPAIIEAETTTVVIHQGDRLTVNSLGWLDVALR
jgi:N-methylhydantoinase A